jgi:hypothetical protein
LGQAKKLVILLGLKVGLRMAEYFPKSILAVHQLVITTGGEIVQLNEVSKKIESVE